VEKSIVNGKKAVENSKISKIRGLTQYMETKMQLSEIISVLSKKNLLVSIGEVSDKTDISSIGCDSRTVREGQLFFIKGVNFRREYIDAAEKAGAVCCIGEESYGTSLPFIKVSSVRKAMPVVADLFYGSPYNNYKTVGITGTKGKTTTVYMLRNIFTREFGQEGIGLISTNEALCGTRPISKSGTTPEALELYSLLNAFSEHGVKACCMEVSSQGLQYDRVGCMEFFAGAYLNLSQDHISPTEHSSFEEYKAAKKKLFSVCKNGIVNIDDPYAEEMIEGNLCERLITVSVNAPSDYRATDILMTKRGVSFNVNGESYELRMPGEFNVYNALCAIVCAKLCGCSYENIFEGLRETEVSGRMEIFEKNGITVIVDYAHNGLSFEAVFGYVKRCYPEAKTICLFGCQGNKAYDRRKSVPEIVGKYANLAILTSDDPENEDPNEIISEVEKELQRVNVPYEAIVDRERAVERAVSVARAGDVVILAGKGHETTQKVKGKLVYYKGDLASAKEYLK